MRFEKVSFDQFKRDVNIADYEWSYPVNTLERLYDNIKMPKQGTAESMGMDFYAPYPITVPAKSEIVIPTGLRWVIEEGSNYGLIIVPRSGLGFKYGLRLVNTVGVIDADYYKSDNEGHILIKFYNPSKKDIQIDQWQGIAQGIILPYVICEGAESENTRNGGFGSTDNKKK